MRMRPAWIAGLFVLFAAGGMIPKVARADIYKHVDENGVVHFTNTPTNRDYKFYRKEIGAKVPAVRADKVSFANVPGGFTEIVSRCASQFNLDEALIHAVIKAESDYNPRAVSNKGAMGVMQLIPETARDMQVSDPFNPEDNIRGGSRYLRLMLDEFGGNLDLAIAAYNAGPNAVRRHGGIPPYEETRTYVERVKRFLDRYRQTKETSL